MKSILFEIVDILEYINNDYDKEEIREKIKKLSILIAEKYMEKYKIDTQKNEKFSKIMKELREYE